MSGTTYRRPAAVPSLALKLPRSGGPMLPGALWDAAATQLELADGQNAKRRRELDLPSLTLEAPTGETVRLTVTVSAGVPQLHLAIVPRP